MSEWTRRYEYTDANIDLYAPQSGGVYRLVYYSNEKHYVFYVGQSENLAIRLKEHLNSSDQCIRKHLSDYSCYFRYIQINKQEERDKIEIQQIKEFNPTCNS